MLGKVRKRFRRRAINRYGLSASGVKVSHTKSERFREVQAFREEYVRNIALVEARPSESSHIPSTKKSITICMVTYNSSSDLKTLEGLLSDISNDDGDIKVSIVDNGSSDNTVDLIQSMISDTSLCVTLERGSNVGFSVAANKCALKYETDYLLFLNPDCVIDLDTIKRLFSSAESSPEVHNIVAWEPSHRLHETRYFDAVTGEIDWIAGTCLLIKKSAFDAVQGFDGEFFMYGEDVDLSFRLRSKGYRLQHLSFIEVSHQSRTENARPKLYTQLNLLANIRIRKKFIGTWAASKGVLLAGLHCSLNGYLKYAPVLIGKGILAALKTRKVDHRQNFIIDHYDYAPSLPVGMQSSRAMSSNSKNSPLVSVIVRYVGEGVDLLRRALVSLHQQSYKNFEVCLILKNAKHVEDEVQKVLESNDFDFSTSIHFDEGACRSTALWTGFAQAEGTLMQILDYDDFLYPAHLETAILALRNNPKAKIVIQGSFEEETGRDTCIVREFMPDNKIEFGHGLLNSDTEDKFNDVLSERNLMPIQSVTFQRSLIADLDLPKIEWMEDWFLWRLICKRGGIYLSWKPSSVFITPTGEDREKRHQEFVSYAGPADEIARDYLQQVGNQ